VAPSLATVLRPELVLSSDFELDNFHSIAVLPNGKIYFIEDGNLLCVDTDGSISFPEPSAGSHWGAGKFSDVISVGSSLYLAYEDGFVQKYENGVATTIVNFQEYADFDKMSEFRVADDGTCFVSGVKPNRLLVSSPEGLVTELDCHEELQEIS
jgi:hypothetical protein